MRLKQQTMVEATKSTDSDDKTMVTEFPGVRYFHVHFEHLETQLRLALQTLDTLQAQVARLERQLNAGENQDGDSAAIPTPESATPSGKSSKKRSTAARHYPPETNRPHPMNEASFD